MTGLQGVHELECFIAGWGGGGEHDVMALEVLGSSAARVLKRLFLKDSSFLRHGLLKIRVTQPTAGPYPHASGYF